MGITREMEEQKARPSWTCAPGLDAVVEAFLNLDEPSLLDSTVAEALTLSP